MQVNFSCQNISIENYYFSHQGPTIKILCDNPDYPQDNGKVSSKEDMTPETWPECKQLPCQCLGKFFHSKSIRSKIIISCRNNAISAVIFSSLKLI